MKRLKSVLVLLAFAVISLMLGITSTAAFADERGDQENRQKNSRVEQRGGGQQKRKLMRLLLKKMRLKQMSAALWAN